MKVKTKGAIVLSKSLCLFVALLLAATYAFPQSSLPKAVTIAFSNEKMDIALKKLETASGITFGYDARSISRYTAPTVQFEKQPVDSILNALFRSTNLSWKLMNGYVVITVKTGGKITGKIVDEENGQAVPDVSIRVGNKGTTSALDGSFSLTLPKGKYEGEISSVGYGKKIITDIDIQDNQTFELQVSLKREKGQLSGVVVRASARKETIASLYNRQKNAAGLSDGISAEQISATPDKTIGETLKRITGVSTTDNRKVVVRGVAERYNVALLDGSMLPSTDVQERDFEFNLIPSNLVDNIVVAKSVTPDMLYGFAGGLVQIQTKSVPASNFTSVSAGLSVNSRTTGKDFYGYQRGKYDYLGYDDGGRNHFPTGMFNFVDQYNPRLPDDQNKFTAAQIGEQNKRIGGLERLGARIYKAMPSQNFQLSVGRTYALSQSKVRNLGFVGSLTYRNTQTNDYIADMRRGNWSHRPTQYWDPEDVNTGNYFGFNTTLGALLNGGFRTAKHSITTYNLYTHIFDDRFSRIKGWSHENPKDDNSSKFPFIEEDDRPKFSNLLQNKLSGSHQLGAVKVEWNMARAQLNTQEQDAVSAALRSREFANKAPLYQYYPQQASDPGFGTFHRDQYTYKERNLSADISVAYDLKLGKTAHTFKTGFNYLGKHSWYDWMILPIVTANGFTNPYPGIPVQEWGNYMSMEHPMEDLFYYPGTVSRNGFEGKSLTKAGFVMLDSRILPNLRIVGGVRTEYFRADTLKNGASLNEDRFMKLYMDDSVRNYWLPSFNFTYTPIKNLNVRASYAESVIRPGLMENARFARYNPNYGTVLRSRGVVSTHIKNYDVKVEWFPGAGEIISAGYFYKYFDKPAEYYSEDVGASALYTVLITNSDWAKVKGWEFELRKNLGFVYDGWSFLKDIYVSGNLTLQESKVRARKKEIYTDPAGHDSVVFTYIKYPRALYGQVPVIYNLGMQYAGKRLGLNLVYNYMGYKTFVTGSDPDGIEYERPRAQLDGQISYRFLKGKLEAKLNLSNLTDAPFRFFINDQTTYEYKPNRPPTFEEWNDGYQYKEGFSEKFEEGYIDKTTNQQIGDRKTFTRYIGRTFSFTISYNF